MYSSEKYFLCIKSLCPGPGHFLSSASACIMCEWNLLTWPRLNTKLSTINHQMYKEDKTCVQLHLFDQIYDTDNTHCARLLVRSSSCCGWIHLNSKNVFAQLPKITICLHKTELKNPLDILTWSMESRKASCSLFLVPANVVQGSFVFNCVPNSAVRLV